MSQFSGIAAQSDEKLENKHVRCSFQPENLKMCRNLLFSLPFQCSHVAPKACH